MSEELIKLIKQKVWCVFPFVSISIDNDYTRYETKMVTHFYYKNSDCNCTEIISKEIFDCCDNDVAISICDMIARDCITYIIDTMEENDV